MTKLPRVKAGDPITDGLMNTLLAAAEACHLEVAQGCGLVLDSSPEGGYVLSLNLESSFDAKVTGPISGGTYPWIEVFPAAAGTWTAGTRTGVGFEENGNTGVPTNTIVKMRRSAVDDYRFAAGEC